MSWSVNLFGTRAEIQTALNATTVEGALDSQQLALVVEMFNKSMGVGGYTGTWYFPSTFLTNSEFQALHLMAGGSTSGNSIYINFKLDAVRVNSAGGVVGSPPSNPLIVESVTLIP